MPKKFNGENSKAAAARARKEATKHEQDERRKKEEEDEYWRDDDKHINRKLQRKVSILVKFSFSCYVMEVILFFSFLAFVPHLCMLCSYLLLIPLGSGRGWVLLSYFAALPCLVCRQLVQKLPSDSLLLYPVISAVLSILSLKTA